MRGKRWLGGFLRCHFLPLSMLGHKAHRVQIAADRWSGSGRLVLVGFFSAIKRMRQVGGGKGGERQRGGGPVYPLYCLLFRVHDITTFRFPLIYEPQETRMRVTLVLSAISFCRETWNDLFIISTAVAILCLSRDEFAMKNVSSSRYI